MQCESTMELLTKVVQATSEKHKDHREILFRIAFRTIANDYGAPPALMAQKINNAFEAYGVSI